MKKHQKQIQILNSIEGGINLPDGLDVFFYEVNVYKSQVTLVVRISRSLKYRTDLYI